MPCTTYNSDENFDRGYAKAASNYCSEVRQLEETIERFATLINTSCAVKNFYQ